MDECSLPTYRDPSSHIWEPKRPVKEMYVHGAAWLLQGFWGSAWAKVKCMNGKWYNVAQDAPGLGDFSCRECVQVGEPRSESLRAGG